MFTNRTLRKFLEEISEGTKFVKFDFVSPERFAIELKCKVDAEQAAEFYNQYATDWIEKFSKFTATTWNVRTSFPRVKRMVYRKVFVCHRSAFNKKVAYAKSRNQQCKANINFKVKFINRNTIKNDPLLKQGLNLCIRVNFKHTHKVGVQESFNLLKSTSDTDKVFYEYFDHGHTPVSAKAFHELVFIDKYGDKSVKLSNATINPKLRHVLYLYGKRKLKQAASANFEDIMAIKKEKISAIGGILCYDNPQVVVVITPTMRRVIAEMSLDDITIDSVLVSDQTIATFLYISTKIGALLFACILHKEQTETNYSQAFFAVKLLSENETNKNFEPKNVLVNNLKEKINALEAIFPSSKIIVSPWSICCEVWRWLCEDHNKIDWQKRHNLMVTFSSMVHADTSETAREYYEKLNTDEYVTATPVLQKYFSDIWTQNNWMTGHENKNELIELSVRVNQELAVSKCKSFNIYAMVDVVSNIMESHCRQILLAHIKGRSITEVFTKFLDKSDTVLKLRADTQTVAKSFKIEIKYQKAKKYINFRTDTWCCDCKNGKRGQFCEHLCAILNTAEVDINTPALAEDDRRKFIEIAGGEAEDYESTKSEGIEENEVIEEKHNTVEQEDVTHEIENLDNESVASVPSVNFPGDDYYYLEVKTENIEKTDPLHEVEEIYNDEPEVEYTTLEPISRTTNSIKSDFKTSYANALKAVNDEFRRLNRFFKENPNGSNKETMVRLARELGKIRPVEKVDLRDMCIEINSSAKKRRHSEDDNF